LDVSQLTAGQKVAAGAGLALVISLFMPWYGVNLGPISAAGSGWEWFTYMDLLLFLVGAAGVGVAVPMMQKRLAALFVSVGPVLLGLGGLALALVLFRTFDPPSDAPGLGREIGLVVALIASAGVAYGGKLLRDERGFSRWRRPGSSRT